MLLGWVAKVLDLAVVFLQLLYDFIESLFLLDLKWLWKEDSGLDWAFLNKL